MLSRDEAEAWNSVTKVFDAIADFAELELRSHYRRRNTRPAVSTATRLSSWAFGAIGLRIPLVADADPMRKDWSAWGYVALAATGTCFGANARFIK